MIMHKVQMSGNKHVWTDKLVLIIQQILAPITEPHTLE